MLIKSLMKMNGAPCDCGKKHEFNSRLLIGSGVLQQIPDVVAGYKAKKVYVLADRKTYRIAGQRVCELLSSAGIVYSSFCYEQDRPEPDEERVGSALMHMSIDCDLIIGVGSGVINDISKILAAHTGLPYIIVATAPSMDGYASMSSSVTLAGIKISLPSRCADVIVGDTEIIKRAPKGMILSGIGDMLAKYISICEWRIAHILVGEYYCEDIARLIREALSHTLASAEAALEGDEDAVIEIFNALIIGSVAMNYAGVSRPASGVEHYISHLYDTRGVEFGEEAAFHGIQCAIATLAAARLYEKLIRITPSRERGLQYVADFDIGAWNERLEVLLGKSAKPLIELEKKEGKYDKIKHSERLSVILDKWDEVVRTVEEEIPQAAEIEALMKKLGMPTSFGEIGMRGDLLPEIFCASKDIRDKYVLSRLLWDIGLLDEFANSLSENSFEAIKKQI